jgi:hypothetical protein
MLLRQGSVQMLLGRTARVKQTRHPLRLFDRAKAVWRRRDSRALAVPTTKSIWDTRRKPTVGESTHEQRHSPV